MSVTALEIAYFNARQQLDRLWKVAMTISQVKRVRRRMAVDKRYKTALANKGKGLETKPKGKR